MELKIVRIMEPIKKKKLIICLIISIVAVLLVAFWIYKTFIYPTTFNAICDYLDDSFNCDYEILGTNGGVNRGYYVRLTDGSNLTFNVYSEQPFNGMSHPFIFPIPQGPVISDNFIDVVENHVIVVKNLPIKDNTLELNLCDENLELATDIVYEYAKSVGEKLEYYKKIYSDGKYVYSVPFTIFYEDEEVYFYISSSDTKEEIRELINKYYQKLKY